MPHVYILKSEKGQYYIGSTSDLKQRLVRHASGSTPSTKRLGMCKLVFQQEFDLLADARYIEARLKKLKRKDDIEKIVIDGFIKIKPPHA
jgi:putative endonuclease